MEIRLAKLGDINEIVDLLNYLSPITSEEEKHVSAFYRILSDNNSVTVVAVDKNKVVGVGSLFILSKILRGGSKVGQIEDVVVLPDRRGEGIGKQIIDRLVLAAKSFNCYKVILNCAEHNIQFYEKCGFHKHELQMRRDLNVTDS